MALGDAALIKDNHVAAAGGIAAAVEAVRAHGAGHPAGGRVRHARPGPRGAGGRRGAGAAGQLRAGRHGRRRGAGARHRACRLEASGGLTLDRAREVAATGVDYLAVGALTHSAPVLDLGFDLRS